MAIADRLESHCLASSTSRTLGFMRVGRGPYRSPGGKHSPVLRQASSVAPLGSGSSFSIQPIVSSAKPASSMSDLAVRCTYGLLLGAVCALAVGSGGPPYAALVTLLVSQVSTEYWGFINAKERARGLPAVSGWVVAACTTVCAGMVITTFLQGRPQVWLSGERAPTPRGDSLPRMDIPRASSCGAPSAGRGAGQTRVLNVSFSSLRSGRVCGPGAGAVRHRGPDVDFHRLHHLRHLLLRFPPQLLGAAA